MTHTKAQLLTLWNHWVTVSQIRIESTLHSSEGIAHFSLNRPW